MKRGFVAAGVAMVVLSVSPVAAAQTDCVRTVIFTLPGVTWADVRETAPPALLDLISQGAVGSVSVRTNSTRTTLASGFATIGAGARTDGGTSTGGPAAPSDDSALLERDVPVAGVTEVSALLDDAGYGTVVPGALASALGSLEMAAIGTGDPGIDPPIPLGFGRWTLLAAMDEAGIVDLAATTPLLLTEDAAAPFGVSTDEERIQEATTEVFDSCAAAVIDHGDLARVALDEQRLGRSLDAERATALEASDRLLRAVAAQLDPARDLLLVVSPTSPAADPETHLGIGIAVGPGFVPGSSLSSATTGRPGIVTLPDVAPTVLAHLGIDRPPSMLGRPWFGVSAVATDRVAAAILADDETVFIDGIRAPVSTAFVLIQIALYAITVTYLSRDRKGVPAGAPVRLLAVAALAVAAFPVSAYLAGAVQGHSLGTPAYVALLLIVDAMVVSLAWLAGRRPLERLFAVAALTLLVFAVDLVVGGPLQINTVFGYSPVVAGRFSGIGNSAFAVLAVATVLTGTLVIHRWGRTPRSLGVVAALFVGAVVLDGAPNFGSDVGGALALVPGLGLTWVLLSGRKLTPVRVVAACVAALIALGLLLAFDLSRPEESQTHLARLFEDVRARGFEVFENLILRKLRTNLRVAGSTIWTFIVPSALGAIAWLLLRPEGRWRRLSATYPALRAGLIGGLLLAVLGFAVNDSGIVIPAMMFSYLVPVALLAHLSMESAGGRGGEG